MINITYVETVYALQSDTGVSCSSQGAFRDNLTTDTLTSGCIYNQALNPNTCQISQSYAKNTFVKLNTNILATYYQIPFKIEVTYNCASNVI